MWASAPTKGEQAASTTRASGAQRSGRERWVEIAAEITPKGASNAGQSLSQPAADSSLCTREPFPAGDEGCGLPRRFAPRNDSPKPLSFRGGPTGRRGNPSFLRWTGVRAAVPRAWPPPTKFPSEIWGVGQVVGPYGKPDQPPKPAGAQRSVRARSREGWAGIDARIIPKGGPPPRPPRQRLAKRKARKEQLVKFDFCPMTSECSTAYWVRKSQQGPARVHVGTAITE